MDNKIHPVIPPFSWLQFTQVPKTMCLQIQLDRYHFLNKVKNI